MIVLKKLLLHEKFVTTSLSEKNLSNQKNQNLTEGEDYDGIQTNGFTLPTQSV